MFDLILNDLTSEQLTLQHQNETNNFNNNLDQQTQETRCRIDHKARTWSI
jgi:hypothetical protein